MPRRNPQTRIGISGWTYGPWRWVFYPKGLAQKRELEFASRQLNSIEINGSFYSLQRPSSYQAWHDATPDGFVFSVKGARFITHMKKLRDVEAPVANFFASGVLCLRNKLGPILWQFPPNMRFEEGKFQRFFEMLPRDTKAAAEVAKGHDERMKGRSWTKSDVDLPIRYAVEIRHESFKTPAFVDLLRQYDVALVFADTAGKWPYFEDVTADFIYARLHGDKELYVSGYTDSALDWWAARLCAWREGKEPPDPKRVSGKRAPRTKHRDVYVYFDNDVKVRAPFDAINLAARMSGALDACVAAPDSRKIHELPRTRWPGFRRARRAAAVRGRE